MRSRVPTHNPSQSSWLTRRVRPRLAAYYSRRPSYIDSHFSRRLNFDLLKLAAHCPTPTVVCFRRVSLWVLCPLLQPNLPLWGLPSLWHPSNLGAYFRRKRPPPALLDSFIPYGSIFDNNGLLLYPKHLEFLVESRPFCKHCSELSALTHVRRLNFHAQFLPILLNGLRFRWKFCAINL